VIQVVAAIKLMGTRVLNAVNQDIGLETALIQEVGVLQEEDQDHVLHEDVEVLEKEKEAQEEAHVRLQEETVNVTAPQNVIEAQDEVHQEDRHAALRDHQKILLENLQDRLKRNLQERIKSQYLQEINAADYERCYKIFMPRNSYVSCKCQLDHGLICSRLSVPPACQAFFLSNFRWMFNRFCLLCYF